MKTNAQQASPNPKIHWFLGNEFFKTKISNACDAEKNDTVASYD